MTVEEMSALALGIGFFAFMLVSLILTTTHQVEQRPAAQRVGGARFWMTAFLFLPMAFVEEAIFRWFFIGELRWVIGLIPAFLLSMGLFILAHRPNERLRFMAVLNLAIVGAILGFVFLRWGIWVATAGHAGWNLAEWGMGYAVSGEKTRALLPAPIYRVVKGEPFGPEGHWSTTVVLLAMLFVLVDVHRFI
ncbi:MAG: CPBP family intramembrane metalloprotease [Firmicutes bacterium]|nr:CPBP family intramembrane metalloprotease [Bacillota bacterium]